MSKPFADGKSTGDSRFSGARGAIAETATDYSDRPLEDQVMKTVVVDTFGEEYPEPETV